MKILRLPRYYLLAIIIIIMKLQLMHASVVSCIALIVTLCVVGAISAVEVSEIGKNQEDFQFAPILHTDTSKLVLQRETGTSRSCAH